MAHNYSIYIRFDFGTDEERAQQARHKLDGWRQAFRLDKRVQYKMDREENPAETGATSKPVASNEWPPAADKPKGKVTAKSGAKAEAKVASKASENATTKPEALMNGKVSLLVRLYFSSHEKLSEQRWLARIPSEEPFKNASPKIIHQGDAEFEATDKQFEDIA